MRTNTILLLLLLSFSSLFSDSASPIALSSYLDRTIVEVSRTKIPLHISKSHPIDNLKLLQNKKVDFAIINSDDVSEAFQHDPSLRVVMALYPKVVTFVVKKSEKIGIISSLKEIQTKNLRIDIVDEDADNTIQTIFQTLQIPMPKEARTFTQASKRLRKGEIDGFIMLSAHPFLPLTILSEKEPLTFIPLYGKKYDRLKNDHDYFFKSGIPKGLYGLSEDIKSIAVKTLLVTREDVPIPKVDALTQTLLTQFDALKERNYIYRMLSRKFVLEGLCIPQHKGAVKAFNAL